MLKYSGYSHELEEGWNNILDNKLSVEEFCNTNWERFRPAYYSIYKKMDDADLYIKLYDCFNHMSKLDVTPFFKSDGQIINYFKITIRNDNYAKLIKTKNTHIISSNIIEDEFQEEIEANLTDDEDIETKIIETITVDNIMERLNNMLTPKTMEVVLLLSKGYTRNQICELVGSNLPSINNRLWQSYQIIKDVINDEVEC